MVVTSLLQIFYKIIRWKNFENRSIFGEHTDKSMWLSFLAHPVPIVTFQFTDYKLVGYNHIAEQFCFWLARLLRFKRPLLSVDVSVSVCLWLPVRIHKDPIGKCLRRVDWWRYRWRHVALDIKLMTSQSSNPSHSETRTRINYPCGPFKTCWKLTHSA